MVLRPFFYAPGSCASYLSGCTTQSQLAVVDPYAELVDDCLTSAELIGSPITAVFETHVQADHSAVSDVSQPRDRAWLVGVHRFWRDFGFVLGALIVGLAADAVSPKTAIVVVAALTAASGLLVVGTSWQPRASLRPAPVP